MSDQDLQFAQRASELRLAFDRSFAEAPRAEVEQFKDLLAIRVGADPYAIHLTEISALFVDRTVTRLPNVVPEFLGIASFRGAVVPVYDLRALLGYAVGGTPRWLVITSTTPVALAFDAFDGHLRLPRTAIAREDRIEHARKHVGEALRTADFVRPIVDVASILETIKKRAQQGVPQKER